ncbi:MAG: hypothetical protein DMG49_27790, partial [Acidobacteria bacterium]
PKSGGSTELALFGKEGPTGSLGKKLEEFLCRAEMAHDAEARSSVWIAIGFDNAPVALPADGIGLEARHDSYIPRPGARCKQDHNGLWYSF